MLFDNNFNYAAWTAGTVATLCNVPWNSDYKDVVRFKTQNDLNAYLNTNDSSRLNIDKLTQLKFGEPVDLDIPMNKAMEYNYIRVTNSLQPIEGDKVKSYYYFVKGIQYVAPNTTRLYLQLDVWQTFIYQTTIGKCFVERSHLGIANGNSFSTYGRDYLTTPEGMDLGSEYQVMERYSEEITNIRSGYSNQPWYMVVTNVPLMQNAGTQEKPNLNSATGNDMENLPNSAEIYFFPDTVNYKRFLADYSSRPWVTQGVLSVTAVPNPSRYSVPNAKVTLPHSTATCYRPNAGTLNRKKTALAPNWRGDMLAKLPTKYRKLTKLLTYPYCVLELTTNTGMPVVIKPELWLDPDANIIEMAHFAPPSPRIMAYPFRYNAIATKPAQTDNKGVVNDNGEFLDMATGITNFPTFSILNNSYASFMASNAASLAYQHSNADYSRSKAMNAAQQSANQSAMGIAASNDLQEIGINAQYAQTNLSNSYAQSTATLGALSNIAGGAALGPAGLASGVAGAAMSSVNVGMQTAQANMTTDISAQATRDSGSRSNALTQQISDSNKTYANQVANGDYAGTIAGINARVQDAKMVQNTTSGQVGGEAFILTNYQWGYDLKVKMLDINAMITVGDYWLRFGYSIGRFMGVPSDLKCMTKFSYHKFREVYLTTAKYPEEFKQTIRGILEKGVTVWSNPNDIGNVTVDDNEPLEGIYY